MSIPDFNPAIELTTAISRHRKLASQARAELDTATPLLTSAIRNRSGQSAKIEAILWSVWNDEHPISLCDALCGLDTNLGVAILAMIAARIFLAGDADDLLHQIIEKSNSHPPERRTKFGA